MARELAAVLHNVRSVHNVGSIFRTADGAGFQKIYLCGITPGPLDRFGKVRADFKKVSLGAENSMEWEKIRSTTAAIRGLQKEGYKVYAIEQAPKALDIFRAPKQLFLHPRVSIVMGNEVQGLSPAVLRLADRIFQIPMRGRKESLNVGVAFGIAAYQCTR